MIEKLEVKNVSDLVNAFWLTESAGALSQKARLFVVQPGKDGGKLMLNIAAENGILTSKPVMPFIQRFMEFAVQYDFAVFSIGETNAHYETIKGVEYFYNSTSFFVMRVKKGESNDK